MKNYQQMVQDAVQKTRELYNEFGRTPLKLEIQSHGITRFTIDNHCGGYDELLKMAGCPPLTHLEARNLPIKSSNEIFRAEIPEDIKNREIKSTTVSKDILCAGDMHLPWVHEPTLKLFHEFNGDVKPGIVVQIGDLYDMYSHARFPKSSNIYTPKDEESRARAEAEKFWRTVHERNPLANCIQFKGNHDVRPIKSAITSAPNLEHFVEAYMEQLFSFEGVTTIADHREIVRIEGIAFHHGYLAQLGMHRDAILESMVVGHTHLGGVSYRALRERTIWELNCGLMGDPSSKVMSYTSTKENKWTLGFGYIDKHGPRFIAT
jgi:predicted phosphodiesterase